MIVHRDQNEIIGALVSEKKTTHQYFSMRKTDNPSVFVPLYGTKTAPFTQGGLTQYYLFRFFYVL